MASAVFGELFGHFGRWLALAWLPWLLGTIVTIVLVQFYWRNIEPDWPPQWLLSLGLAPFSAMIFVRILKNIQLKVPVRIREFDFSQAVWQAALVIFLFSQLLSGVDWLRDQLFEYLAVTANPDNFYFLEPLGMSAGWIVKAAIMAIVYGLFAIIVEKDRIDILAAANLVRGHFTHLFALALLLGGAYVLFFQIYASLVTNLNLTPFGSEFAPILSAATTFAFLTELLWFPVTFLADVLPAVSIGVIYVAFRDYRTSRD